MIFEKSIEDWPVVEVLIAFYSNGFPYEKVLSYVERVSPFMVNDLAA
jgi:inositol hexakisphosphate/diphosphoinositol-pentakisphosphate kinase